MARPRARPWKRSAGGVRRRTGRDGMQGERLASGVRTSSDAVVDGGAEELLESVGWFEVEGGDLGVAPDAASPTPLDEKLERPVD